MPIWTSSESKRDAQSFQKENNNNIVMIFSTSLCFVSCFPEILSNHYHNSKYELKWIDHEYFRCVDVYIKFIWHFLDYYHMITLLLFRLAHKHHAAQVLFFDVVVKVIISWWSRNDWLIDWLIILSYSWCARVTIEIVCGSWSAVYARWMSNEWDM